jgi:hypothetical protein
MRAYTESPSPDTIIRVLKRENPYVMIERTTVQDKRLSWEARGLLVYLLSLPTDWDIRVSHLQTEGDAGRDALRRMLRELQKYGYTSGVGRDGQERGARGRFGETEIRVYESPELNPYHSEASPPSPENPSTVVSPSPGLPSPVKASPYIEKNLQKKDSTNNTHTPRASAPAVVVCAGSKFSLEDCRRYADHLHASGQGMKNSGGFAKTIHRTGDEDLQIATWLAKVEPERVRSGELPAPSLVDASACPDCEGKGLYYPDPKNPGKGVAKCKHSRLPITTQHDLGSGERPRRQEEVAPPSRPAPAPGPEPSSVRHLRSITSGVSATP